MIRLIALAAAIALTIPTLAAHASEPKSLDPHELRIQFVTTPTTLEECVNALQGGTPGAFHERQNYLLWNGEHYLFAARAIRVEGTGRLGTEMYCTKLKPLLVDGTQRED